jgi:ACS family tartrate transporter-like MFS transporter
MLQAGSDSALRIAECVRRKRLTHIIPYVFLLYIIAFLDRVNVGYAALQMNQDLHFGPEVFGFGAGIFFFGYFLLEIPSTIIVERWSAKNWIARILITWGIIAGLIAFVRVDWQFYLARFALGLAEAGFFPGIILYLTHWYRREEQARAVALFMTAIPVSNIIGAPVSGFVLDHVTGLGLAGWQWVFIIEAVPAVVFGALNPFLMIDRPADAKWLTDEEKAWLESELQRESSEVRAHGAEIRHGLKHPDAWKLAAIYFCQNIGFYGFGLWLPQILKQASGSSDFLVSLMAMIPYLFGLVAMVAMGQHSDRTGERKFHVLGGLVIGALGFLLSGIFGGSLWLAIAFFAVAAAGLYSIYGAFWSMPSSFVASEARAAAIGLVNSVGNLGGFVGPYMIGALTGATGSYFAGLLFLVVALIIGSFVTLSMKRYTPVVAPVGVEGVAAEGTQAAVIGGQRRAA